MNDIVLFVYPTIAALGAFASLSLFVVALSATKNKSVPRAGSGPAPAFAFALIWPSHGPRSASRVRDPPDRAVPVLGDEQRAVVRDRDADRAGPRRSASSATKPIRKSSYSPVGWPSLKLSRTTL